MKNRSVFDSLYGDAKMRKSKVEVARGMADEGKDRKPKINDKYFSGNARKYVPLFSRLNNILETRETKRKEKQGIDLNTGK